LKKSPNVAAGFVISRRQGAPGKDKMNIIALRYEVTGTCQENEHCRKERTILMSPVGCENQLNLDLSGAVLKGKNLNQSLAVLAGKTFGLIVNL